MTNTVSNNKSIQINETELVIKKIPLRRLIGIIEDISQMEEWKKLDKTNEDFINDLPSLIGTGFPRFTGLIAKAINQEGIDGDWLLDNVALDEAIEIAETIFEVNNVQKIVERIKKVQALAPKAPVLKK